MSDGAQVESLKDFVKNPKDFVQRWKLEKKLAEKEVESWNRLCDKIIKRYKAERVDGKNNDYDNGYKKKFNILWSNTQVLSPSLYARTPKPQITKRNRQNKDDLGRLASEVWERATDYEVHEYDFDAVMGSVVLDYLLCGRGVARVRYEMEEESVPSGIINPETGEEELVTRIKSEHAVCEYVSRKDFLHSPARKWEEVRWVGFKNYLTKDEIEARFGEDVANQVNFNEEKNRNYGDEDGTENNMFKKCCVLEIWDKSTKQVIWLAEGFEERPLDVKEDILGLEGFFPCPKPLYATLSNDSLIPTPDYKLYQDQAIELDILSERISALTDSLRVNGIYDADSGVDLSKIAKSGDGKLIGVRNFARLADKGGLDGAIQFMPIEQTMNVLTQLYQARSSVLQEIYEITGISDIIRGQSNPNETAAAQQIKSKFGTLRLSNRQAAVQIFARDSIALKSEIIAEKFDPERIRAISGFDFIPNAIPEPQPIDPNNPQAGMMPPQDNFPAVIELLRNEPLREYRIDIETDSTIALDDEYYTNKINEYLGAVGSFLERSIPQLQQTPELAPFLKEALLVVSRGNKIGRQLEGVLETSWDNLVASLQQQAQQEPPPDPRIVAAQLRAEVAKEKMQVDMQKHQGNLDIKKYEVDQDQNIKIQEIQIELEKIKEMYNIEMQKLAILMEEKKIKEIEASIKVADATIAEANKPAPAPAASSPSVPAISIEMPPTISKPKQILISRDENGLISGAVVTEIENGAEGEVSLTTN